jgi:type IV secretion system protein VirB8
MMDFEATIAQKNHVSKNFAWVVVAVCVVVILCLAGAIFKMLPLKMTDVKVLVLDKVTGQISDVSVLSEFATNDVEELSAKTALNKFWIQQYINFYENYEVHSVRDAYSKVRAYSSDEVFNKYNVKFNPVAGGVNIEQAMRGKVLSIKIKTIEKNNVVTPFNNTDNGLSYSVRVIKQIKKGNNLIKERRGTIRMTFGYLLNAKMDEKTRNINPLGFTVTSYRFDSEQ